MQRCILSLAIATLLTGAAAAQSGERPGGVAGNPAAGGAFARKACATCHAVTSDGVSPRLGAPTFGQVSRKYADYRLDWELEAIAKVGHYAMPPKAMTTTEIADVTAYIRSLDDETRDGKRRP